MWYTQVRFTNASFLICIQKTITTAKDDKLQDWSDLHHNWSHFWHISNIELYRSSWRNWWQFLETLIRPLFVASFPMNRRSQVRIRNWHQRPVCVIPVCAFHLLHASQHLRFTNCSFINVSPSCVTRFWVAICVFELVGLCLWHTIVAHVLASFRHCILKLHYSILKFLCVQNINI